MVKDFKLKRHEIIKKGFFYEYKRLALKAFLSKLIFKQKFKRKKCSLKEILS